MSYEPGSAVEREALSILAMLRRAEQDGRGEQAMILIAATDAYMLIGALQLMCRHPDVSDGARAHARRTADRLAVLFDKYPALKASLEAGWRE